MEEINDYELCSTEKGSSSGCTFWKAKREDDFYFLKKFTQPKFPKKPEIEIQRQKKTTEWYEEKKKVSERLLEIDGQGKGNVICPLEYFVEKKSIYVASYWEDRKSLEPKEISRLSEDDKIFVLLILSSVLESVHDKNVVHADLKPDNILIVKNEKSGKYIAKVLDFDESFISSNPPVEFKSEPLYRSPEVVQFRRLPGEKKDKNAKAKLTCASDVFSMGIIFHEYWSGKKPDFEKDESVEEGLCSAVMEKKTITLDSGMPLWLQTLIRKMINVDYKKRPAMQEIHSILLDVKNGKYEEVEKRLGIKKEDVTEKEIVTEKEPVTEKEDVTEKKTVLEGTSSVRKTDIKEKEADSESDRDKADSSDKKEELIRYYIEKCKDVISHEPYDLNRYDKDIVSKWKTLRRNFNLHRDEIKDVEAMKNCYEELEKTLRDLKELKIVTLTSGYQGKYVVCEKLPDEYSEVRIKDDNKIIVTTRGGGKLIVNKDFAIAHKLIELK